MREFEVPPVATIHPTRQPDRPGLGKRRGRPGRAAVRPRRVDGVWQDVSCAEFKAAVVALAKGLIAAGIQAGDRVGLMSKTRYEWTLIDYAIWAAGAVTVPIYETSSAEQVAWILSDSGRGRRASSRPARTRRPSTPPAPRRRRCATSGASTTATWTRCRRTAPRCRTRAVEERRRNLRADDVATIIYTSGTTGRPKGCVLTHRNMYSDIANAIPGLRNLFNPGRQHAAVPAAGALVRPADPDRRGHRPVPHRAQRRRQEPGQRPGRVPADVRARRAPGVREGLQRRQAARPRRRQGRDLRPGRPGRGRLQRGAGHAVRPGLRPASCSTGSSTGWSTASCGPRSAAGARRRSPAAPRSAPGSRTSSAASA